MPDKKEDGIDKELCGTAETEIEQNIWLCIFGSRAHREFVLSEGEGFHIHA